MVACLSNGAIGAGRRARGAAASPLGHGWSLDADPDRNAVGDDVERGRSGLRLHHDLFELLGVASPSISKETLMP